jgi:hypothetical protein
LPAGSRITDVITMLMNADTFEWFKYRYNLEDSQVMKKYVRMCMRIAPSMGMEVKHDSNTTQV